MNSNRSFIVVVFFTVLFSGLAVIAISRGWFVNQNTPISTTHGGDIEGTNESSSQVRDSKPTEAKPLSDILGVGKDDIVVAGGVERPRLAVEFAEAEKANYGNSSPLPFAGAPNPVDFELNETTKLFEQDLANPATRKLATSIYANLAAFDTEAFRAAAEEYLNQTRPARVYQSATANQDVTPLKSESPMFVNLIQGEGVNLRAAGQPGMPITFHCNQIGTFENGLKTISLAFDDNGEVVVPFKTGSGSVGLINVLAASPVHSGQLKFVIRVRLPSS